MRSQALSDANVSLTALAGMDEEGMRRVGLVTPRARRLVVEELTRAGLRR